MFPVRRWRNPGLLSRMTERKPRVWTLCPRRAAVYPAARPLCVSELFPLPCLVPNFDERSLPFLFPEQLVTPSPTTTVVAPPLFLAALKLPRVADSTVWQLWRSRIRPVDGTLTGVRGFGLSEEAGEGMVRVAVQKNYQGAMLVVVMGIGTWLQWQLSLRKQSTVPTSGLRGR
jgi:hypothetical protein